MKGRLAQIAIVVTIASGCYSPSPAVGVRCSTSGACPVGQECDSATDTCVLIGTATEVDAGSDAGDVDAPIDAAPDAPTVAAPQFRSLSAADDGSLTMNVATPAGAVVGDLLLAHVSSDAATIAEIGAPAGWTQVVGVNGDNAHCTLAYYRFVSDPTATYTWRFSNAFGVIRVMAFSGVDPTTPIDAFDTNKSLPTEAPTAPSITTTQAETLLVVLFAQDLSATALAPVPAMTPLYSQFTGELNVLAAYTARPTAGATGARSTSSPDVGPASMISIALAPN